MAVTITISDEEGKVLQQATCYNQRMTCREFDLQRFLTENPDALVSSLDIEALTNGNFHCTHAVLLGTGETVTVRDFLFVA